MSRITYFALTGWLSLGGSAWVMAAVKVSEHRPGTWSKTLGMEPSFACHASHPSLSVLDQIVGSSMGRGGAFVIWLGMSTLIFLGVYSLSKKLGTLPSKRHIT